MSDNGESSREPQVATSEGGEAAAQAPATTTSTRSGAGGKVQRRSLPRTTRDTNWASGSGIGPGVDSAAADPPDAHGAAAAGVATPGSELPHRGQLEGAFGLDLSSIVAHTGPEAQQTSRAMGANAYATGHHVILPQNAGVGLVAHEVTHVLQQEQGVHLSGGLDGGASDPLEQQADAVGAAVERGESVAGRFSAPRASASAVGGAIQRDSSDGTTTVAYLQAAPAKEAGKPAGKPGKEPTEADKAEAIRRFRVDSATAGMQLVSTRWQAAMPLVYGKDVDVNAPIDPQKVSVPAFRQNVYNLLVVDRTDASPAQAALEAPGRDDYKTAFVAAQQDLDQDTPYVGQIKESIENIVKGGQMNRNRTRLIAHHAMLRPAGKRAMAQVPSLGTQALADYLAGPATSHGKLEDDKLGAIGVTTHVPTVEASQNAQGSIYRPLACRQLYDMLHGGAPALEATTQSSPAGEQKAEVKPEVQQKVDALRTAIETALGKVMKGTDGAPFLPYGDQVVLVAILDEDTADARAAREIVHADAALMKRLVLVVDPTAAKLILGKLDPVEQLFRDLDKVKKESEPDGIDNKIKLSKFGGGLDAEKIRELIPFKENSPVYAKIRQWLNERKSKDKAALRLRLLDHTKLKDDFIDRLIPPESRIIYRLIYRGTEDPGPEDKVHEAAEKKDGVAMVLALRELAGADAQRLKALEKDSVFRASASAMNEQVKMPDGQLVRPWHVCMVMWGLEPGATQDTDPNTAKLSEYDPSGNKNPLTIDERMKLEGELLEACIKELNAEITGKNMRQEYTYLGDQKMKRTYRIGHVGDPQAVSNILVTYDRKAAQPDFVKLLQREHMVFGREIERRYQERFSVDLRTWIYENAGPVNRSGANRVLGSEQGASVGMFNGKMLMAGEMDQKGKMTLAQALREHTWEDRPIYEWASVSSRAIAHNLGDKSKLLEEWDRFALAVGKKAPEITTATGINVRAIDLLRNAYMEHSGHFQTHLQNKYKDKQQELTEIKGRLGLTDTVDVPADAKPPTVAEEAERNFSKQAKELWDGLSGLNQYSPEPSYTAVGVLMNYRRLPTIPVDPKDPAVAAPLAGQEGYTVEERPPRSFNAYYRLNYGTSPELHAAALLRTIPDPRMVTAEKGAQLLGIDPKKVTGDWATPEEKAKIGDHNRHLVRASFTMDVAAAKAKQIWQILTGNARLDLIQTILGEHNDEEQALIRAEFRILSGGFDLTFYIRQMMAARAQERDRLSGESKEISVGNVASALGGGPNKDAMLLATNQWAYRVNIGTGLADKGNEVAGINQYTGIQSRSTQAELEQMLSIASTGNMDPRARLRGACERDSQHEIKLIVDELTVAERRQVLADGELMNLIYAHLEQFDEERVYKILTGQGDLADRLYSRSHGGSWSERKIWGGTDEDGMRQDIRLYVRQMRLKHNADVRGEVSRMVQAGNAPPRQDQIDKEVDRRVGEACLKLASNDSVRAIMKSELTTEEFAEMESMIKNGTADARDWAVAGGAGKTDILADIKAMSLEQRKERLADPNYMRLLGTRLREEKDYREALTALQEGIGGGGSGLGKLDEVSRSASQAEGSKPDGQKTLDALTCLSQIEFQALKNNPALQAQVMSAMTAEQQVIAREYLGGPDPNMKVAIETAGRIPTDQNGQGLWGRGAGSKGGSLAEDTLVDRGPPQTVGPDGKPLTADQAAKQAEAQLATQKEAYVRFIVHQSIHRLGGQLRSKTSWSLVLEAAVEIYKADLPAISADKGAKLDAKAPRQLIWAAVAPHMTVFSVFHDTPANAGQMTLQPITGSEMRGFVQAAVLGQADPSEQLIESKIQTKKEQDVDEERLRKTDPTAATKKYGLPIIQQVEGQPFKPMPKNDVAREEDIKDAIGSASDDKVIKNWTTYLERPPGGTTDHTMKARYDAYRTAFDQAQPAIKQRVEARKPKQKPVDVSPKSPPPVPSNAGSSPDAAIDGAADKAKADAPAPTTELGALGDKDPAVARMEEARGRFIEFRATESVVFEAMLRQFMGDDRTLTADGTYDPNKAKISITKNKRYNNLVEALLHRALSLRPETIAAQLGIHKDDLWLLKSDMRGEVGNMALSQQKNLRYSGAQRSVGGTALEEKQQLDVTTFLLYKTFADATTDYKISGEEKEKLAYRRDQNDRARDSYKTALETAAMWASLITSVLVTLVATILTGGLALGPIGMMAIGGVTILLSAHAQAAVNKEILQDEFDSKDKRELITKEVMTGLVTMGTTFFAQGLLSTLGKGARLFQQTTLMKQVLQKPPSIWGVFLREASEEVLSEGMDNVVEAHLEATNPEHFVDGMKIGAKRARAAADAILARAPDQMFSAALTSLVTAGVGKLKKGKGKPEFDAPKDARKRTVNIRKNLKMVFGDPEEKFTAAGIEWLMQQRENGKIDWDNAPAELLKGLLQEYKESVHEVHGQYAHHGMQSRKVDRHLATQGHHLQNSTEVAIFTEINKNAGTTDPFVSAKDFARIRTEVAIAGLQTFEQQNGPLTNAQREAFVKYVREAKDTDTLHARAKENPLSVRDVKYADADAKANTAVGKSMASDQTAFKVLRDLADGKTDSLKLIGVEVPPGFDPTKNEWGLGRRIDVATGEVSYILIKGEDGAVNWEGFPGVEPIAHSHPDKGPNGRNSNHLKKVDGDGGIDVVKLCNTEGADRIHFLPSGADMVFVLAHRINEHTVLTPFQSLGGGRIGNPTPGSNSAGINIVMKNPKLAGYLFGNKTSPVAEVEFEIWAGNQRLHTVTMWGSDHLGGSHLWSSKPTDLMGPVNLAGDGQAGGAPGPRRTPTGQRDHDDNGPPPTHPDPNHPANRRTQQIQIPTVTPQQDPNAPHNRQTQRQMPAVDPNAIDQNAPHNRQTQVGPAVVPGQQQVAPQQSEYDQATDVWKKDQTSPADLKGQIDSEEWETALGHIKEARLDPEIGPTIAHIPDHELVALFLYTDYHYRRWNLALRDNDHDALQKYAARIKAADSALAAMPSHEGWVERGTGILDDEVLAKYQPGQVVTEQAFTSASAGQGNQGGFTGGATVFRIKSKTGKRIDKLAKRGDNETEVLFRPGTRFVVTERSQQDHTTIITMEELDSETDTTRSGSNGGNPGGAAPTGGADPTLGGYRTAQNGPRVNQRNQARLGNMNDGDRTRYSLILEQSQNEGQRVILERALAAGRSLDELHILRMAMNDMSEQDVLRDFSGAGIIQFYQHSCVPTSYQIAIADVDPFYALQLRNNPSMMMQQQRDPLVAFGGAQYPRHDLRGGRVGPGPARDQVSDPLARRALEENGNYSPASDALTPGIEATQMHGTPLHQQLQAATGVEYDVITSDHQTYDRRGQGQFPQNQIPHDRIRAAVDAHLPVIFSMMGHTSVIVGIEHDPGGDPDRDMYLVSDPADGRIARYPAKVLDAAGVANLTLPRLGEQTPQGGGRGPHDPRGGDGTTRTGARQTQAPIADRVQGLLVKLQNAEADHRPDIEQQIRHLLPATFASDWLHANKDKLSSDELSRLLEVLNSGSRAASDRRGQERHQRDDDDWSRSKHQEDALAAAKRGESNQQQRDLLVRDINRQVPDVALTTAVQGGKVHSIISLVVPGGGPTGIKTLNDELIGSQLTDELIMPQRNALIERAFRRQGITVVEQNFKQTTLVSPHSAADTQAKIKEALQEIDKGMKPILQHALLVGLREWEAKSGGQARVQKIKNLLIDLSGGKYTFDAQVGTTDFTAGKTATYEQILAAKMNANKAALMGREGRKKGGGRTTVYTEEGFLAYARETADLLTMLEGRSLTLEGQLLPVVVGDTINRDILRDLRKGKIKAKDLSGEQQQTLTLLQSYFDHVNSLDYIKHARGDELAQTQVEIEKAQGLIDRLQRNRPQPGDAEAIEATLQGQRAQAGTASEAQFFNQSAKGGERLIVSADMKDLGLEVFDDYAGAMAQINKTGGADLDKTSASADNRVLERKRGAVQEFLRVYEKEILPAAIEEAVREMKYELAEKLATETSPPVLLGGDEITISLHPAFEQFGLMPRVMSLLANPGTINARVAVARGTDAKGQRDAMKAGRDAHDALKDFEKAARNLDAIQLSLPWDKRAEAEGYIAIIRGLYVSVETRDGASVQVLRDRNRQGQEIADPALMQKAIDDLLKAGGFDPKKGGGGGDGQVHVAGMGQSPKTYPWRENAGGVVRTADQAVEIARAAGVLIPTDIAFFAVNARWLPANTYAEYMSRSFTSGDTLVHWEELYNRFEMIAVKFSREILSSDEAIVAIMAHEMHELNNLRDEFNKRGGAISATKLRDLIQPGIAGNLHDQAWDIADAAVNKMRNPKPPGGPT